MGTLPEHNGKHRLSEECSNSANFTPTSVWRTVSKNCHTPLVRSPAARMKVVTMVALLKLSGLQILFWWTFSKFSSGFRNFRSWQSATDSNPTVQKATAFLYCSSVTSWFSCFAALACRRAGFGLASGATGAGAAGSGSAWIISGKSSGEEDGLRDGSDKVLRKLWGDCLPKECDLPMCWIWWGRVFGNWGNSGWGWGWSWDCSNCGSCGGWEGWGGCGGYGGCKFCGICRGLGSACHGVQY